MILAWCAPMQRGRPLRPRAADKTTRARSTNFRDERDLPFEYQGAVSRWRIELPRENNYFDMDTLSDMILP